MLLSCLASIAIVAGAIIIALVLFVLTARFVR